jgi:hypothetical protein
VSLLRIRGDHQSEGDAREYKSQEGAGASALRAERKLPILVVLRRSAVPAVTPWPAVDRQERTAYIVHNTAGVARANCGTTADAKFDIESFVSSP